MCRVPCVVLSRCYCRMWRGVCVCVVVSQARTGQTDSDGYANESPSVGRCVCFATVEPECCCDDLALPCCTEQRYPTRDAGNYYYYC